MANERVARQLIDRQSGFDRYWVSPYVRAQQTADDVLEYYADATRESVELLTPEKEASALLDALAAADGDSFLLIGHNPLVTRFVALFIEGAAGSQRYLGTSELFAIEAEVAAPACGVLKYSLTP